MIKKKYNVLALIILIAIIPLVIVFVVAFSPITVGDLYITGNDVIKNYSLESFDGDDIVDGTVPELDNKLKFELGAFWKTTEADLEIINTYVSGDVVSIQYFVTMRNKANIYTNVRLPDAIEKNFNTVSESFLAGSFEHLALDGNTRSHWESYLTWHHYDFGNVMTHNLQNNLFSGVLKASFDINPNPIPMNFTDDDGNLITKQFDYISISGMWVSDSIHGKMSTDLPDFVGLTPSEYESDEENDYSGGAKEGSMTHPESKHDYSNLWDPDTDISDATATSVDSGIQPATVGSTLSPKTKEGVPIWDPVQNQKSMEDCEFAYNLGALSPLVYEYMATLSYKEQRIQIQDEWVGLFVLGSKVNFDTDIAISATRQVGLHVTNRYIQTEFSVKFKLFTSFKIVIPETEEAELEKPEEYYYELLWRMIVDGFGGGKTYIEASELGGLADLISIIIVIVIVIAGIYIFVQVGIPLIVKKQAVSVMRKR